MSFTIHRCEQRSDEWKALRLGRLCASRAHDIYGTLKSGAEPASRRNLRVELVLERLTGRSQDRGYINQAMQDGIDREPWALAYYEAQTGVLVESVGFVSHDSLMVGCSPDGCINGLEGGVEIKSPIPATHLEYLRTAKIPADYLHQVVHSLWITGAQWWDWLSFQPMFPDGLQIKATRVHRKDVDLEAHERLVRAFLEEVDHEYHAVRTMADLHGQLQASVA